MFDYLLTLTSLLAVGVILALSLNLVQGYAGTMSVSHGAAMGVGAYIVGVTAERYHWDTAWTIVLGVIGAAIVGWLFMTVAARLDPDDFVLASFALQMVIVDLFTQWTPVTHGSYGLFGIHRPTLVGIQLNDLRLFTAFVLVLVVLSWAAMVYVSRSGYGVILRGIRESYRSVEAVGKNVLHTQVVTFAVSSGFAGLAGGIYATSIGLITPGDFNVQRSILVVAFLLVGGIGNMTGAVLGAVALLSLPEAVKQVGTIPTQWLGPGQQIVYGIIIVLFVWLRPQGIIRERPVFLVRRMLARARPRHPGEAGLLDASGD